MTDRQSVGRALSRAYFTELVEPLIAVRFPGMRYSAGRLGAGSDVLGLDDETSRDHDWGLRLALIVPAPSVAEVRAVLAADLPASFRGLPTRFTPSGGTAPRLHVEVSLIIDFLVPRLGFDPRSPISTDDWLSLSGQSVLEITAGPVFKDLDGELTRARSALSWYPDDLWRYVLACDWAKLAQELPLMSRAADVGDDRGSRLVAARLAHVTMHLAFVLERRWAPYAKWFGTAFRTLHCATELSPSIDHLVDGADRDIRERGAAEALQSLLYIQNSHGLTDISRATIPFWDRPYLHPDPAITSQLMGSVSDPTVRAMRLGLGSIEQRTENVDVLVDPKLRQAAVQP